MIRLSESLGSSVREQLNYLYEHLGLDKSILKNNENPKIFFDKQELDYIVSLSLNKMDIKYLQHFSNIEQLSLSTFPSLSDTDFSYICNTCPNLRKLTLEGQQALFSIDLKKLSSIEELSITNCRNLKEVSSLYLCRSLKKCVFYNNSSFENSRQFVDFYLNNKNMQLLLDIHYYEEAMLYLEDYAYDLEVVDEVEWVESCGRKNKHYYTYSNREAFLLFTTMRDVVGKYCYVDDGEFERLGILYAWYLKNVRFVNGYEKEHEDLKEIGSIYDVFTYGVAGRKLYANAFLYLLHMSGLGSSLIYSNKLLEQIGYYNGKKVLSLEGNGDYSLLKVKINTSYSYVDLMWNAFIKESPYEEPLRLFLVGKEEIDVRHVLIDDMHKDSTRNYAVREINDLLLFAEERMHAVEEMFFEIEQFRSSMNGVEFNRIYCVHEIQEIKDELGHVEIGSDLYKELFEKLIKSEEELHVQEEKLHSLKEKRMQVLQKHRIEILIHYLGEKMASEEKEKIEEAIRGKIGYGLMSAITTSLVRDCL